MSRKGFSTEVHEAHVPAMESEKMATEGHIRPFRGKFKMELHMPQGMMTSTHDSFGEAHAAMGEHMGAPKEVASVDAEAPREGEAAEA